MTKEETAYADALNLLGTGFTPISSDDVPLLLTLEDLRFEALASTMPPGPKVRCPRCPQPFAYNGPLDGEHFAELWDHLGAVHHYDPRQAELPAKSAWSRPRFESVMAA